MPRALVVGMVGEPIVVVGRLLEHRPHVLLVFILIGVDVWLERKGGGLCWLWVVEFRGKEIKSSRMRKGNFLVLKDLKASLFLLPKVIVIEINLIVFIIEGVPGDMGESGMSGVLARSSSTIGVHLDQCRST